MDNGYFHQLNTGIAHLSRTLKPLGLTVPAAPDTDDPVIPEVTLDDISEAVANSKDPAADKTVQRLVTAHQLGKLGIASGLLTIRAKAHDKTVRAEIPALLEQVREIFHAAAEVLEEHGAEFRGHRDLGAVDLQTLPLHAAEAAAKVLGACRTMTTARAAWVALSTYGGMGGHAAHWSDYGAPSQDEYTRARDARPQGFPDASPWSIYRKGWTLDLPANVQAARERRTTYMLTAKEAEAEGRREGARRGMVSGFGVSL